MNTKTKIILFAVFIATIICSTAVAHIGLATVKSHSMGILESDGSDNFVEVLVDDTHGNVCYKYVGYNISCVKNDTPR